MPGICLVLILLMKSFVLFTVNSDVLYGESIFTRNFANCYVLPFQYLFQNFYCIVTWELIPFLLCHKILGEYDIWYSCLVKLYLIFCIDRWISVICDRSILYLPFNLSQHWRLTGKFWRHANIAISIVVPSTKSRCFSFFKQGFSFSENLFQSYSIKKV